MESTLEPSSGSTGFQPISMPASRKTPTLTTKHYLGYRYQTDNDWVIGIEGRFGDRNGELSDQNVEFKFDRLWRLLPTIGKTFGQNGNNLVYGKLGVGGIRLDAKVNGTTLTSQNFEGVVGAIGYERALSDKLSLHTELSYISYDPDFDHWQPMVGVLVKF